MRSSPKINYSRIVLSALLVSIFLFGIVDLGKTELQANELVDCIIIKWNACPSCVEKYETYVDPFFQEYNMNESIDFEIIDASDLSQHDYYLQQMALYNISTNNHGGFPRVIFIWDTDKTVVLDIDVIIVDNDIIYTTFNSILVDIGYTPPDNNGTTTPSFDVIDIPLLGYTIIIVGGLALIATSGGITIDKYSEVNLKPKRIEKNRLILFSSLSVVSIIALTYQFMDYLRGGCGCASTDLAKTLLFRKYEIYRLFDFEIPFALVGISIMTAILIQVVLLGFLPLPMELTITKENSFKITKRFGEYWYYFVVFQLFLTVGALLYLLYLELFVINFICILCTISQIIIVINTLLIMTWDPFPKKELE
ncbi:MAG: hypothetical protein ACW97Z_15125 [Candidatus Hodarchaeales archaeon]|jgi:uncharacterized membrane protein